MGLTDLLTNRQKRALLRKMEKDVEKVYDLFFPYINDMQLSARQQLMITNGVYGVTEALRLIFKNLADELEDENREKLDKG